MVIIVKDYTLPNVLTIKRKALLQYVKTGRVVNRVVRGVYVFVKI